MNSNDILRRVRYALDMSNADMSALFLCGGHAVSESDIPDILKKEKESGFVACSDRALACFLDGLIIARRGKKDSPGQQPQTQPGVSLSNNMILKKLRIAFNFKEDDMLAMFRLADCAVTRPELSALFRRQGSKHYKECGDQRLKKFLHGVTLHFRPGP